MARKRSRSPFPVTRPRRRFTLPSFLSPLRRSIRSFPLLGGVSRRCNLRLNCQSTGYYFPVSLPGRSGRLGAEPGGRQEKTERVPWRKLAPGEGRAIDPCFFLFFSLNRRGGSRAFCLLPSYYYRRIRNIFSFSLRAERGSRIFKMSEFLNLKSPVLRHTLCIISRRLEFIFRIVLSTMTYSRSMD